MELESVQIGTDDVAATTAAYELLLGVPPVEGPLGPRFALGVGAIDVVRGEAGVASVRLLTDEETVTEGATDFHGLAVLVERRAAVEEQPRPAAAIAIDHVVVNTSDVERAILLWRDRSGLRLALDREFPQRGLRLVFFRSGGITLEIAGVLGATPESGAPDRFWGVAYRVPDLPACRERLLTSGVSVSEIRAGHKRGTIVATVRSHTAGVPTLLIASDSV